MEEMRPIGTLPPKQSCSRIAWAATSSRSRTFGLNRHRRTRRTCGVWLRILVERAFGELEKSVQDVLPLLPAPPASGQASPGWRRSDGGVAGRGPQIRLRRPFRFVAADVIYCACKPAPVAR